MIISQTYKDTLSYKIATIILTTVIQMKRATNKSKQVNNQSMNWIKDNNHFTII